MATTRSRSPCGPPARAGKTVKTPDPQVLTIAHAATDLPSGPEGVVGQLNVCSFGELPGQQFPHRPAAHPVHRGIPQADGDGAVRRVAPDSARGQLLAPGDIGPGDLLVAGEGGVVIAIGCGQLTRENIGANQGQAGAQASERCRAVTGIADQRSPAAGPAVQAHLADRVKEEVGRGAHGFEQPWDLPSHAGKTGGQDVHLPSGVAGVVVNGRRAEAEPGLDLAGDPSRPYRGHEPAGGVVHEKPAAEIELGSRGEPGRIAAERADVLRLGDERQAAYRRVQPVSSDYQAKPPRACFLEGDRDPFVVLSFASVIFDATTNGGAECRDVSKSDCIEKPRRRSLNGRYFSAFTFQTKLSDAIGVLSLSRSRASSARSVASVCFALAISRFSFATTDCAPITGFSLSSPSGACLTGSSRAVVTDSLPGPAHNEGVEKCLRPAERKHEEKD